MLKPSPFLGSRRRRPTLNRRIVVAGPKVSFAIRPSSSTTSAWRMSRRPPSRTGHSIDRPDFEALPAALLVVGGDPLGGDGLDLLDAVGVADHARVAERLAAGVAEVGARVGMGGPAFFADVERRRGQFAGVRPLVAALQDHPAHPMASAFVVDEAVRPELGDADEARALDRRPPRRPAAPGRNERDQGQAREVVARQEPFGREVAVGVEIGLLVVAAAPRSSICFSALPRMASSCLRSF